MTQPVIQNYKFQKKKSRVLVSRVSAGPAYSHPTLLARRTHRLGGCALASVDVGAPRFLPISSFSLSKAESLSLSVLASGVVTSSSEMSLLGNRIRRRFSGVGIQEVCLAAATAGLSTITAQNAFMFNSLVVFRAGPSLSIFRRLHEKGSGCSYLALFVPRRRLSVRS